MGKEKPGRSEENLKGELCQTLSEESFNSSLLLLQLIFKQFFKEWLHYSSPTTYLSQNYWKDIHHD